MKKLTIKNLIVLSFLLIVFSCSNKSSSDVSSSDVSSSDVCSDMKFYKMGVYGGEEDSSVYRECDDYWEIVVASTSPYEMGPDSKYCFCVGYNSVEKSF